MIFVTGGRNQGKTEAARTLLKESGKGESSYSIADGRTDAAEFILKAELILHLETFIRRLMEEKQDVYAFAEQLMAENPGAVITADEIGCGIVPIDAFEREYRETDGRVCQRIAAFSEEVPRDVRNFHTD